MTTAARKSRHSIWFWVALAAIALAIGFMLFSPTFKGWVEKVAEWAEGIMRAHRVGGAAVFFALTAVSALLTFASSIILVPPATEVFGNPVTFLLLWGGWMVGSIAAYAIGYFARPLLVRLVDKKKLAEYQALVSKRMKFWVALVFCFAAQSELSGYVLGGLGYSFWKFVAAIGIAEAVFAFGVIVAGDSILEAKPGVVAAAVGIMLAVAIGAGILLKRRSARRRK